MKSRELGPVDTRREWASTILLKILFQGCLSGDADKFRDGMYQTKIKGYNVHVEPTKHPDSLYMQLHLTTFKQSFNLHHVNDTTKDLKLAVLPAHIISSYLRTKQR